MEKEINEVEMLGKNGDTVIDVEASEEIFSQNNSHYIANPSLNSRADGETNQDPLQISMQQGLDVLPGEARVSRPVTIFRVPIFRKGVKNMHEPQMVSIGPYHHGKEALRPLEKHKWWLLRDFLSRKPEIGMDVYLKEMRAMAKQTRQCYNDIIEMSNDEFVSMLLLDGCFILEYFLKIEDKEDDYITDVGWDTITTDILLLENQIPYSVIHKLGTIYYHGTVDHNCEDKCRILNLVCKSMAFEDFFSGSPQLSCTQIDHLLHLYHLRIVPVVQTSNSDQTSSDSDNDQSLSLKERCLSWLRSKLHLQTGQYDQKVRVPSAMELREAGVTFKKKNDPRNVFDLTFENGVMEIPYLYVAEPVKIMFTNVLLYEQAQDGRIPMTFTSYLILMDFLMDTSDDVAILKHCGVIENLLPNDDEVALFFNQLCDYTMLDLTKSYYLDLYADVQKYINLPWHSYRATLVRDYFSNPWAVISFIAAILLLLLTVTQTGFSIYPVVHHN